MTECPECEHYNEGNATEGQCYSIHPISGNMIIICDWLDREADGNKGLREKLIGGEMLDIATDYNLSLHEIIRNVEMLERIKTLDKKQRAVLALSLLKIGGKPMYTQSDLSRLFKLSRRTIARLLERFR